LRRETVVVAHGGDTWNGEHRLPANEQPFAPAGAALPLGAGRDRSGRVRVACGNMSAFAEYDRHDGLGLAELVRKKDVSPIELVESAIESIEKHNPRINAVILTMFDQARSAAQRALPEGRFRGVPFLLKDILAAHAGVPMRAGSRFYEGWIPPGNSLLVDRFLAAGVVVVGKTNTPEFALLPVTEPEAFGPTRNPWNTALTAGGSSGGSAAAVASRMVPMASGGDGGGSLRMPASCCGVFGLKPTRGRVPTGPFEAEVWNGFSAEHVITRSVRDSAAMLDAVSGTAIGEPYSAPRPDRPFLDEVGAPPGRLRIAFSTRSPLCGDALHADCLSALEDAVTLLRELGHDLVEAVPDIDGSEWKRASLIMMMGICAADVRDAERRTGKKARRSGFDRGTWLGRAVGETFTAGEYAEAVRSMQRMGRKVAEFVSGYDAWVCPTLGQPPLPIGALYSKGIAARVEELIARLQLGDFARRSGELEKLADRLWAFMPFTMLANGGGLPSMSVPLRWNADNVPIGTMVTGRYGDEASLYRLASQLEHARPWADRRPATH
jgi:amidase